MRIRFSSVSLWTLLFAFGIAFGPAAVALTGEEIAASVVAELDNVNDYTATVNSDFSVGSVSDMTAGSLQWKRGTGSVRKVKMVGGSPYSYTCKTDGGANWNITDVSGDLVPGGTSHGTEEWAQTEIWAKDDVKSFLRFNSASDLFNMEQVLDVESWTKAESTETINSISCYKIYTSKGSNNYEVWVDVSTVKKVIRVKATDDDNNLEWQLDYSGYSNVESTAWLPSSIATKMYSGGSVLIEVTHTFSNIDINAGLADSIFALMTPP